MRIRHPLNPEPTEMFIHMISAGAGLERQIVSIVRLPPGKESFLSHAHTFQEEFVFILEGQGEAIFGDESHSVGPGDFVGYPCDGVAHQLRNTSDADLVYLVGGERTQFDLVRFPDQKKVGVFTKDGVTMYDESEGQKLSFEDYVAKD